MKKFRKTRLTASLLLSATIVANGLPSLMSANADYGVGGTGKNIVEKLNRGIYAVNSGNGMFVSWRYNADDPDNAEFRLYRDDKLIYTSKSGDATSYLDKDGSASSVYRVDTLNGDTVVSSEKCSFVSNKNYFDIPMDIPPAGDGCTYNASDCSVGDVDGDGTYELFVKWDPSNAKDNSQDGQTGNVYIDCYRLSGQKLWRIDLGKNIRAGAHYTQFLVADFDCDGKAEMTCKTADGTKDGTGKVIGDASKDYRNSSGYILSGPEYYTLFEGATGKALDTVEYAFPRGKVSDWGDNYGNRVDRFLGAVVYCDGVHPSAVSVRGYYTRMTAVAYDVVDKKLVVRWKHDSGNSAALGYHNGNHNCMPGDVDNDGKQELVLGSTCIDDNGKVLWCNQQGHGDAMHLSDFLPDREGLELWMCHEQEPYGVSLIDAKTGKNIFRKTHSKDTGRACCGNILASNPGSEFWGATGNDIFDGSGKTIASNKPSQNFMIYWDGDLEREILDGTKITKYISTSKINTILTADGCASNNGSKSNPCLAADILGDWREELLVRTSDNKSVRVYCTTSTTDVRLTTLMHDVQYRTQASGEQNCYNQPAHPSFFLGTGYKLPERPNVTINGTITTPDPTQPTDPTNPTEPTQPTEPPIPASDIVDGEIYTLRNVNSGMYLTSEGNAANGSNIYQSAQNTGNEIQFKAVSAGNGYFYLVSQQGDGNSYAIDVNAKKKDDGTNIELYTFNKGVNQQFKLVKNDDGTYSIFTGITDDTSCIEVNAQSTESGANIQQWTYNGGAHQKWYISKAGQEPIVTTTTVKTDIADIICGDANDNGTVEVADAVFILQGIADPGNTAFVLSEAGKKFADADGNGMVDAQDAFAIQQFKAGLIDSLPIK